MPFCGLKRGITPKIRKLCFVLMNSVIVNLLRVRIFYVTASLERWQSFLFQFFSFFFFSLFFSKSYTVKVSKHDA